MASLAVNDQLRAAVTDGRTENIRYRQNQLQSFHATLRSNADKICDAIAQDSFTGARSEAEVEYHHAMSAITLFYSSLDFEKSLKDEYLLANGLDNTSRRVGRGLVVLRPTTHTRFYSIVCPIAAAIAAGNCICLELGETLLNVDRVLRELLPDGLDCDTFYISKTKLEQSSLPPSTIVVDQVSDSAMPTLDLLVSNPSIRTIAVVDRGADIEVAAKAIVTARFSFQGTSPYSPDIVLVNDFVKNEFVGACAQYASKFYAATGSPNKSSSSRESDISSTKAFKDAEANNQISIFGSNDFMIVNIKDKTHPITKMKVNSCHLPILECTSLVDAIMSQNSESTILALYIFADPPTAKFLGQHFNAAETYVNQIPLHLLLGPSAPISLIPSPRVHKYCPEMFSSPRPQYISPPPTSSYEMMALEKLCEGRVKPEELKKIRERAVAPLPKTGQKPGHAIGFFEQGILIGVGLFLSVTIPAAGYASWVVGRSAWKLVARARMP